MSSLSLHQLSIDVSLGVSDDERSSLQQVWLDLSWEMPHLPRAADNDDINDTICYHELSVAIQAFCLSKPFKLIEHLGWSIYQFCHQQLPSNSKISLTLYKAPPVNGLNRVAFSIQGEPS